MPTPTTALLCTPMHSYALLCTPMHSYALLCTPMHSYALLCTPMHSYALLCTPMHSYALLCTPMHSYALLCTPMHSYAHLFHSSNPPYHLYTQYLILCNDTAPVPIEPLPFLPPGYLGPQPTFSNLALRCATHVDPYVQTTSGVLDIAFGNSADLPAVRMTSQLVYVSAGRSDDVSEYILQQTKLNPVEGTTVIFALRLPFAGLYKLQVIIIFLP